MKINVGCGVFKAPSDWVNVDVDPLYNPDVLAVAGEPLPFDDHTVERVYLGHVLEHMEYKREAPAFLRDVKRILAPNGQVAVVGPDYDRAVAGEFGQDIIDAIQHRQPEGSGDQVGFYHQWTATGANTLSLVKRVWRSNVNVVELAELEADGWPLTSLIGWQVGILCMTGRQTSRI